MPIGMLEGLEKLVEKMEGSRTWWEINVAVYVVAKLVAQQVTGSESGRNNQQN